MTVAALYDIHANLPALEAVLGELGTVDTILVGGDVVWGPWPQETMDALRSLPNATFIMGNADRDVFDRAPGHWKSANDWCADRLSEQHLAFLRSAPATASMDGVLFCHGSPQRDTDIITVGTPPERILGWCEGVSESTVACGHTHGQFDRSVGALRVVNPGSVGNPFGDFGAYWALFHPEPELRFTPYDVERTAARIVATGFPYGERMASDITTKATPEDAARFFEPAPG